MDKRLSEAAIQGDVTSLLQILEEDPLILENVIISCVSDTPLHVASVLGHLDFVRHLLSRKPELAGESDSRGRSPLHLAAARGRAAVVRELLLAGGADTSARDADGLAAVHAAAIKGRAAALAEMVRAGAEPIRALTDRGETGLHLCVKWNRVEAARVLAEAMGRDGEIVNWKDCEGNTALHIAVANKNIEIINHLLTLNSLQVNALNKNGLTSLDLLRQSPRDLRDMEIENVLRKAGASTAKDLHSITADHWAPQKLQGTSKRLSSQETRPNNNKPLVHKNKSTDWLGRKRSALMVVASLIATVAFQAGLTPPGGVWQDDYTVDESGNAVSNPHTAGQSVMAYREPRAYGVFMIFNTIAFLSSLSIILLLVSGLPMRRRRWLWVQMVIMWVAITAQVATYFVTLRHMSPRDAMGTLREVTEISVLTWMTLMSVVFVGNLARMNLWVLRKYGYIKQKERDEESVVEEDDDDDQ